MSNDVRLESDEKWQLQIYERGPAPSTFAGLAWRMIWIWPPLQVSRYFAILAAGIAIATWSTTQDATRFAYPWSFALFNVWPIVPIFYFQLFDSFQPSAFTVSAGRALAMLPATRQRLRDTAWLVDVMVNPLITLGLLVAAALFLPVSIAFKGWFIAIAVLCVLVLAGFRASMVLGQIMYARAPAHAPLFRWLLHADGYFILAMILSFFAIIFAHSQSWPLPVGAAVGAATVAWSWMRMPYLASGKGAIHGSTRGDRSGWNSHALELCRIFIYGPLFACFFILVMLLVPVYTGQALSGFMGLMVIFSSTGMGSQLAMRTRVARHLPLRTAQLTASIALYALVTSLPGTAFMLYLYGSRLSYLWLVLLATAVLLNSTAVAASSVLAMAYHILYMLVLMALVVAFMITSFLFIGQPLEYLILFALATGIVLLPLALYIVNRYFLWNSKVYRPLYQNPQQNQVHAQSEWGENTLIAVYFIIGMMALVGAVVAVVAPREF